MNKGSYAKDVFIGVITRPALAMVVVLLCSSGAGSWAPRLR